MQELNLQTLVQLTQEAGEAVLSKYAHPPHYILKEDRSPQSEADVESHKILVRELGKWFPEIPILSEEGECPSFGLRQNWDSYFLIDPMDGTKGFIRKDGEFTVNVALIRQRRPILGAIHVPLLRITYVAGRGLGAYKCQEGIWTRLPQERHEGPFRIVASRDDVSENLDLIQQRIPDSILLRKGSSLKFCMIAEGTADLYPRTLPCMEWDAAAGTILVEEAGGCVHSRRDHLYNTARLLNPGFCAAGYFFRERFPEWKQLMLDQGI